MKRPVIAVLASGDGTTAEAFIRASADGAIQTQVGLIITNNKTAGILRRVANLNKEYGLNIATAVISGATHPAASNEQLEHGQQSGAEEAAILEELKHGGFDLIVLMGYMKRMGSKLVSEFGWRPEYTSATEACMLNTHPGLLPDSKGWYGVHVQEFVLKNELPEAGQTLHVVSEDYDEGPIVAEHKTTVLPEDTADSLFDRVKILEKKHLPQDVENFILKRQEERNG